MGNHAPGAIFSRVDPRGAANSLSVSPRRAQCSESP